MSAFDDLLTVQEHDSAADHLRHRRETLPERTRLAEVEKAMAELDGLRADVSARRDEVGRRQQRVEDELGTLEDKVKELDRKLYSGTVTVPRELQALQADVQSLKRHQSDLEDQVLAAMQDADPLDGELARINGQQLARLGDAEGLQQAIDETTASIDAELASE